MKTRLWRTGLLSLAALLLSASLLSACGGGDDPVDTTPSTDTSPISETVSETLPETVPVTEPASETVSETVLEPATETESEAPATAPETTPIVEPDPTKVADISITARGDDIYKRLKENEYGYRYGCTYLYNDDGSVDAYFACTGIVNSEMNEWDWISYRHSPDGGKTWEPERIVLTPTHGSQDSYSLCDPGVVYFGGYYYLAYTSTMNSLGKCNNIYVARSENPDGPFEKWNGEGWGGYDPQPIFYYDETHENFGIGEPSFVELNGTLYIYYSHIGPRGDFTMVATADSTDENWPATLTHHGAAVRKSTDSLDVKYVEEWGKFIAVAAGDRMTSSSWLALYESLDGVHFELVDLVREGTYTHMHNVGISSRPNGHIRLSEDADKLCVVYAYGAGWGTWNTRLQPITLAQSDGNDMLSERMKNCLPDENLRENKLPVSERSTAMLRTDHDVYFYTTDTENFRITLYRYDQYFEKSTLHRDTAGLEFVVYDESVVTINNQTLIATVRGVGTTAVEVRYDGCTQLFHVTVTEQPVNQGSNKTLVSVEPIHETYTLYLGEKSLRRPQLRVALRYADGSYTEAFVEENHRISLSFDGYDKSIISVTADGIVTALKVGETTVKVTVDGKTCEIKVQVTDDEKDAFYGIAETDEVVYDNLDFSKPGAETIPTNSFSTDMSYDADREALKLMVIQSDPQIYIEFPDGYDTEAYRTMEITYMAPDTNSEKAVNMQIFYCVGNMTQVDEAHSTVISFTSDGEFHTLTVDLTRLNGWNGSINTLRLDYINKAEAGDIFYIRSVRLS